MKYFTGAAVIFSVLLVQAVLAREYWQDNVAQEYKTKYSKFVSDMTKILSQKAIISNTPQTWACVRQALSKFALMSPDVRIKIDGCVHSAGNRHAAQQCAKSVVDKVAIDSLQFARC